MALGILIVIALLFMLWLMADPLRIEYRRRCLRKRAFPAAWREILRHRVPYLRLLPADLQLQLKQLIQVFIAEKSFVGCDGLVVSDEMRVTIAAQACLLILNRRTYYFPGLKEILIYPSPFIVAREHRDSIGLTQIRSRVLSGESWAQGQVILSWPDVLAGAAVVDDGNNVVIHEFAHQLDQEKGYANGAPGLLHRQRFRRWSRILGAEYKLLQDEVRDQQPGLFNPYGASDPAEFFAVISEAFFEQSQRFAAEHPALYRELGHLYRIDPLAWS
jgi:Mlc titration factor MtfA (ptsG expression regulator)